MLGEICTTTSGSNDMQINNITANADALQILEEAEIAAERRLSDRLPEIGPIGLDGPAGPAPPRRAGLEI